MKTVSEMAREAGFPFDRHGRLEGNDDNEMQMLERFAELVRADEREAMVAEAAKQGWAMKNEDPFEECVCEIAAIRARSQE